MKTNRSLFKYILFNLLTCGIYDLFFIHRLAKDVNEMCEGDGRHTRGLFGYLVLSILTCGIYSFVWWYSLANRLRRNSRRYRCYIIEDGSHFLCWCLFGVLLCGIGPFVALHIVFRNTNELAEGYNKLKSNRLAYMLNKVIGY